MRRYLALQAMESGKPLGRDLLNRGGFAYGGGMLLNTETSSSKVGKSFPSRSFTRRQY